MAGTQSERGKRLARATMTDAEKIRYINEVWQAYLERRGQERLISPIEFSLIRFWRENSYPLRVVLTAIREAPKPGRTLMYFENVVAAEYDRWRKAMTV